VDPALLVLVLDLVFVLRSVSWIVATDLIVTVEFLNHQDTIDFYYLGFRREPEVRVRIRMVGFICLLLPKLEDYLVESPFSVLILTFMPGVARSMDVRVSIMFWNNDRCSNIGQPFHLFIVMAMFLLKCYTQAV